MDGAKASLPPPPLRLSVAVCVCSPRQNEATQIDPEISMAGRSLPH